MKKFYIPTSTLNFNNILSSESISPKAFYDKRCFGYSRWATIPENPFDNAIVLYEKQCYFERSKSDIEDHPMLIEVLLDESELKQTDGIWYSDHTIYLTPSACNFLFYSEMDRKITLSMSDSSLETKMLPLYQKRIGIIQPPMECYDICSRVEPCVLNERELARDARINKMKGLLYGYYIGALLSSDIESVKYLNILKEIHNIFAAILSSLERQPTDFQNERLDVLFGKLNEHSEDFQNLFRIINDNTKDATDKTQKVIDYIKSRECVFTDCGDKNKYLSLLQCVTDEGNENPAIAWIKSKISKSEQNMKSGCHLLPPNDGEIIVKNYDVSSVKIICDESERNLCIAWMNETLSNNTNGKINTYKEELATNVTLKAKEVLGNLWTDESPMRKYLNNLRRHIAGEDFKYEWNNRMLSSLAAVVIAGDDWEKLLAFMQSKEMTEYKLAFAFYGVLNGFANLTRDFTDLLYDLSDENKDYVWNVYKDFYKQLHGRELSEPLDFPKTQSVVFCKKEKSLAERVDAILKEHIRVKMSDKERSVINEAKNKAATGEEFIKMIANGMDSLSKNIGIFRFLQEKFCPGFEYPKPARKRKQMEDFFSNDRSALIKNSNKVFPLLNLDDIKVLPDIVKNRIQKNWEYTYDSKNYKYLSIDHIDYFINLCKKEGRGEGHNSDLKGYFDEEMAKIVNEKLKEIQTNG